MMTGGCGGDGEGWSCVMNLGQGNFGVVELWKNRRTGHMNAVKRFQVRQTSQTSEKMVEELKRLWRKEVELMVNVNLCPYIVNANPVPQDLVTMFNDTSGLPTLFMEYCAGGNLRNVLKLPENICGLVENEALKVLDHISKAINFLHEHDIIHRDLKPDNILRNFNLNNQTVYKLSDLGFASQSRNQCITFVGTPQYLAPEMYIGKGYDKTVDYWSFGIIAFEVLCGMRPFLHGESPTNWLPLVERKAKDTVSIYRNEDGNIEFSNGIPFYTHFSDVKKECLVTWLRTMLQVDPANRGKKLGAPAPNPNSSSVGAKDDNHVDLLDKTLTTVFLDVNFIKERLSFPISQSGNTKISEIQQRICLKTGLSIENQLLLMLDGVEVPATDLASKYKEMDLYLIPRQTSLLRLKLRFPKVVNSFMLTWDTTKDPVKLQRVWSGAIFYLQTELNKLDVVKKSIEALRIWCTHNYANQIKAVQMGIEKAGSSLGTVLELEGKLELIDVQYGQSQNPLMIGTEDGGGSHHWTQEMSKLHNQYRDHFDSWVEKVVLKPVPTTELDELYYKVLRACGDWKSDTSSQPFGYNETLVRNVCQFIVKNSAIDDYLFFNIKNLLDKTTSDMELLKELQSITSQLTQLTTKILEQRCQKYKIVIQTLNGVDLPVVLEERGGKENAEQTDNSPPSNLSSKFTVRGGGYNNRKSDRMCRSENVSSVLSRKQIGKEMVVSMPTIDNFPLLTQLLHESEMLRAQTTESINSLNSSMEEIRELCNQKNLVDWDFLEEHNQ